MLIMMGYKIYVYDMNIFGNMTRRQWWQKYDDENDYVDDDGVWSQSA